MKSNQINIDQRQTFYRRKFKIKGPNRFPGINTTFLSDRMASPICKRRFRK